jgi:sirohydrochlorin cobaltochelatase
LPAAPSLRQGWIYAAGDWEGLHLALNHLYPAALANALLGSLSPTPWSETAERQTGRFRIVRELDDAAVRDLVAEVCERGCLKRRLWSPAESAKETEAGEIPLLCPEACNYLVGKARVRLKGGGED